MNTAHLANSTDAMREDRRQLLASIYMERMEHLRQVLIAQMRKGKFHPCMIDFVDDAIQHGFLQYINAGPDGLTPGQCRTWVSFVAWRKCVEQWRNITGRQDQPLEAANEDDLHDRRVSSDPERNAQIAEIREMLDKLLSSGSQRMVLDVLLNPEISQSEIARMYGVTPGAVTHAVQRALRKIHGIFTRENA